MQQAVDFQEVANFTVRAKVLSPSALKVGRARSRSWQLGYLRDELGEIACRVASCSAAQLSIK